MFEYASEEETQFVLYHLGHAQAIVSHYIEKYGIKRLSNPDKDSERGECQRTLEQKPQTAQAPTNGNKIIVTRSSNAPNSYESITCTDSTAQVGHRQPSILDEMGEG